MNTYIVTNDELIDLKCGEWDCKLTSFESLDAAKEYMRHLESLDYTKCIYIMRHKITEGWEIVVTPQNQKWKLSRNNKWRRVKPVYPYIKKGNDLFI